MGYIPSAHWRAKLFFSIAAWMSLWCAAHKVVRFSGLLLPPFEIGVLWWICSHLLWAQRFPSGFVKLHWPWSRVWTSWIVLAGRDFRFSLLRVPGHTEGGEAALESDVAAGDWAGDFAFFWFLFSTRLALRMGSCFSKALSRAKSRTSCSEQSRPLFELSRALSLSTFSLDSSGISRLKCKDLKKAFKKPVKK